MPEMKAIRLKVERLHEETYALRHRWADDSSLSVVREQDLLDLEATLDAVLDSYEGLQRIVREAEASLREEGEAPDDYSAGLIDAANLIRANCAAAFEEKNDG